MGKLLLLLKLTSSEYQLTSGEYQVNDFQELLSS
jgi:hypothetical protein